MKKSMMTVSLLASLPFLAWAGEGNKAVSAKNSRQSVKVTPTPLPTEGLTKEQAEALDSIPSSSEISDEEAARQAKELKEWQAQEAAKEKQKETLKKKK